MRFTNKSRWCTPGLRALVARSAKQELPPNIIAALSVEVIDHRRGWRWAGTHASYPPRTRVRLAMPIAGEVPPGEVAALLAHEFGHLKGLKHAAMRRSERMYAYYRQADWERLFPWAADYKIARKAVAGPRRRPAAEDKLAHAEAMLRRALTREKRARTIVAGWRAKVRYHEKRIAVAAAVNK